MLHAAQGTTIGIHACAWGLVRPGPTQQTGNGLATDCGNGLCVTLVRIFTAPHHSWILILHDTAYPHTPHLRCSPAKWRAVEWGALQQAPAPAAGASGRWLGRVFGAFFKQLASLLNSLLPYPVCARCLLCCRPKIQRAPPSKRNHPALVSNPWAAAPPRHVCCGPRAAPRRALSSPNGPADLPLLHAGPHTALVELLAWRLRRAAAVRCARASRANIPVAKGWTHIRPRVNCRAMPRALQPVRARQRAGKRWAPQDAPRQAAAA